MSENFATRIHEKMTVEDADGDKVGTVHAVYQPVRTTATTTTTTSGTPVDDVVFEVRSGLPLLGRKVYIPSSAIRDVVDDRIILQVDETKVDEQGWEQRPTWIRE